MTNKSSSNLTYKEKLIKLMDFRPFGCEIQHLPPGTVCLFRDFSKRLVQKHEENHAQSILGTLKNGIRQQPKRTKARYFEVTADELEKLINKLQLRNASNRRSDRTNEQFESVSISETTMFNTDSLVNCNVNQSKNPSATQSLSVAPVLAQVAMAPEPIFSNEKKMITPMNSGGTKWECRECMTKNDEVQRHVLYTLLDWRK